MRFVIFSFHAGSGFISSSGIMRKMSRETGLNRFGELVAIARRDEPSFIGGEHLGDPVNVGGNNG
jgi:hypothetical protein